MEKELMKLTADDKGGRLIMSDDCDAIVKMLSYAAIKELSEGNSKLLDILFSVIVHIIALDASGEIMEHFRSLVERYRDDKEGREG